MDAPRQSESAAVRDPRVPLRWIVAFVIAALGIAALMPFVKEKPGDFAVYVRGAERMIAGERVYRPEEDSAFTYPPFCGLYFVGLTPLSEPVRRGCWYFASLILLGCSVLLVVRQAWPVISAGVQRGGPPVWGFAAIVAILTGRFLLAPIENQANDLIVLALVAAAVSAWGRMRDRAAGICSGLAAATKATPLLFLPIFFWQRRFAAAAVMLAALAAATVLPDLLLPQKSGELWAVSWYRSFVAKVGVGQAADAEGAWRSWNMLNQSLAGTLHRLSTPISEEQSLEHAFDVSLWSAGPQSLKALTLAAQFAVLAWLAWVTWEPRRGGSENVDARQTSAEEIAFRRLGQGSAVVCAMLLLSPMSSKQHFCVLFLPIVWCTAHLLYRRRDWFVAGSLAFVFVATTLLVKDIVGRPLGNLALGFGSVTFATIACFAAAGRALLRDRREAASSGTRCRESGDQTGRHPVGRNRLAA